MTFSPPPVQYGKNGYWSLTLYNEQGWVATDKFNTNSHKATPNADGSYTLHFNTPGAINNLEVVENWNGLFRCYLPDSVDSILEFKADVMKKLPKKRIAVTEENYKVADAHAGS
ncbi:MAG: DUF1214 domain-containing protein [Deltaproteobacteria bacterium]|nr:DUF1214 domain-containing protein [Deltaproteobacteria bacterium]